MRLLNETKEALERQAATSEILQVISSSPTDIQPVFESIAESAMELCDAQFSAVFRFDGKLLHFAAHSGWSPAGVDALRREFPIVPHRRSAGGRAILSGAVVHIPDVYADAEYALGAVGDILRSTVAVPMLREGVAIGTINVARFEPGPFSDRQIELLQTFADQAVIAIENVRLFNELQLRTLELTRSVGQLTALGEVGQAVSSTLELDTVLSTIVGRAVQLSRTDGGIIYEYDETVAIFHVRAAHQTEPEHLEALRATPLKLGEGALGSAAVARAPVAVDDILAEGASVAPQVRHILARLGYRSLLAVPLLREDRILGGLVVWRREPGRLSTEVVSLLQTFATQSALAIQNHWLLGGPNRSHVRRVEREAGGVSARHLRIGAAPAVADQ